MFERHEFNSSACGDKKIEFYQESVKVKDEINF